MIFPQAAKRKEKAMKKPGNSLREDGSPENNGNRGVQAVLMGVPISAWMILLC